MYPGVSVKTIIESLRWPFANAASDLGKYVSMPMPVRLITPVPEYVDVDSTPRSWCVALNVAENVSPIVMVSGEITSKFVWV